MQKMGLQLTPEEIYSVNNGSLKDAIIGLSSEPTPQGFFCTGEIVSSEGLMFTNHHCGFDIIQQHSTTEHDYLADGFWAMNKGEELPNEELTASILHRMADVTDSILPNINDTLVGKDRTAAIKEITAKLKKNASEDGKYNVVIKSFFSGNEYYMFVYQVFTDVRLVGAPPGYVGYEEGGQLTEKVRRKPYAVILLDEIEKAHPDVFNILLQILDDGFITDSLGRKIDFRNTIIIMTSNIGARQLKDFGGGVGFGTATKAAQADEHAKSVIEGALKKSFAPEFLNRIDDVIIFNALEREDIHAIIDIELDKLLNRISDLGYTLDLSEKAKDYIADKGFDKKYGARPLKRAIQKYIEDALAEEIVNSKLSEGDTIKMDLDEKENKLTIQIEKTKKKIKTKSAS
jgi:hypothetical protein